jgi:hypothetical protein
LTLSRVGDRKGGREPAGWVQGGAPSLTDGTAGGLPRLRPAAFAGRGRPRPVPVVRWQVKTAASFIQPGRACLPRVLGAGWRGCSESGVRVGQAQVAVSGRAVVVHAEMGSSP